MMNSSTLADSDDNTPSIDVGARAPKENVIFTCMLKSFNIKFVPMGLLDHNDIERLQQFFKRINFGSSLGSVAVEQRPRVPTSDRKGSKQAAKNAISGITPTTVTCL